MFRLHRERAPSCEALAALAGPASDVFQCILMNSHIMPMFMNRSKTKTYAADTIDSHINPMGAAVTV